ncbi:copper chaperone [Sphingobacteriales bacterium UPWRP_1]|nr:hypothetical protein BVG80_07845 [Sphingobacteriales bacterium TSM_CSM]PSJ72888.1 copper chaperone [Sphingobacteriales bacterium UPWRP_1]
MKTVKFATVAMFMAAIFFAMLSFMPGTVNAQGKGNTKVAEIKTSAVCGMCKDRIEAAVYAVKGVKAVVLDVDTKVATVKYNAAKTNPDKIKTAIVNAGYSADDLPASEKAYNKLPGCCKAPGACESKTTKTGASCGEKH